MINKKRRKKKRVCQFCASKDARIDYKNTPVLLIIVALDLVHSVI